MQDLLDAHYLFQRGLYQPCWEDRGPFRLHWHPEIRDADWNHARLRGGAAMAVADLDPLLADLEKRFAALGRPLVVAFDDTTAAPSAAPPPLAAALRQRGWKPRYRHHWLLWQGAALRGPGVRGDAPPCTVARVVGGRDLAAFLETFFAGFAFGGVERPAWERALTRSATAVFEGFEMRHYLARVGDQPAGIATLALKPGEGEGRGEDEEPESGVHGAIAGFYNLAVHPDFRRRGIGGTLQRWRLREARAAGVTHSFLQAESPAVVGWNHRQGFTPGPVVMGLGPP